MGICNNLAGAIGPLILAYYILNDGDAFVSGLKTMDAAAQTLALNNLARRVIGPYIVMTIILLALGILIKFSPLPEVDEEKDEAEVHKTDKRTSIFQYPHLILGVIALFFYVGAEVIAGNTIVSYGLSLGVAIDSAKSYTTMVMITMLIGYVLGILLIPRVVSYHTVLTVSAVLGVVFTVSAVIVPPELIMILPLVDIRLPYTILFVALLGLANSLIWPAIWPLAIHNLGRFIKLGSAMMIMAIAGGAVLPLLWGYLSDTWSAQTAYWMVIPSYLVILFYSLYGFKVRYWKKPV
jgi:fucose permease